MKNCLRERLQKRPYFPPGDDYERRLIGSSAAMRRLFEHLSVISGSDVTVLIEGETGVGKNHVARVLHDLGPRAEEPFVAVNAAALPCELFESELFGHVRGAFSGAYDHHKGLARAAAGGTLFIDEVGDLSLANQAKLLSFLDQKKVRPVGGTSSTRVDLRLIAATNHDLHAGVHHGGFRSDLYYRLRVFPLRVPSLRERPEDVPLLAEHFLGKFSRNYCKSLAGISPAALKRLCRWPWEGNVRELMSEIERAVILTPEGRLIEPEVLTFQQIAPEELAEQRPTSLRASRRAAERQVIVRTLYQQRWNVSAAARELGISRVGLTRKLKHLGIRRPCTEADD